MQDDFSRLLQNSNTSQHSLQDFPIIEARQAVENAVILSPDSPAEHIAESIRREMDAYMKAALGDLLIQAFLVKSIRTARREASKDPGIPTLPGFEALPVAIKTRMGKVELLDANYRGVRDYYWTLRREATRRKMSNPRIKQAKALFDLMKAHAGRDRGVTVREVVLIDPTLE